jgi:hypothetical protein
VALRRHQWPVASASAEADTDAVRRISLSVLAGVALLGATVVVLHATSAGLAQPTLRTSAQLVAVAPAGLTRTAPRRLVDRRSGLKQTLAHLLATEAVFANPAARRPTVAGQSSAKQARPLIQPPMGMTCPVATTGGGGACSIVPCAVYVAEAQSSSVASAPGLGLAVLPSVTPRPSPGGKTPAGTCVSRPGRPPHMRWVSATGR